MALVEYRQRKEPWSCPKLYTHRAVSEVPGKHHQGSQRPQVI